MKYCSKCGKEILDETVICPGCGCPVERAATAAPLPQKKKSIKKIVILSSVGAVVLVCAILALMIFLPHSIELDDLCDMPGSYFGTLMDFGVPDRDTDGVYIYEDSIEFCGVTLENFMIYPDENKYVMFVYDDYNAKVIGDAISRQGEYEYRYGGLYAHYNYRNIEITADPDFSYVSIEVKY